MHTTARSPPQTKTHQRIRVGQDDVIQFSLNTYTVTHPWPSCN
jgi:hypothetical protein